MIAVQIIKSFQGINASVPRLEKLAKYICSRFNTKKATINIAIVNNTQIRKMNAQFLNSNATTDCLSFDLSDDTAAASMKSFDIAVNGEKAVKEAKFRGHSQEAELALYITHGLLHHLGFDDSTPEKAKKMHDTEDEIMQHFGYGSVYNKISKA